MGSCCSGLNGGGGTPVAKGGSGGGGQSEQANTRRRSYIAQETNAPSAGTAPFPPDKIGFHSNHGMKPAGFASAVAKINQDRGIISYPMGGNTEQMLFAVYDGHGAHGELCSEFCCYTMTDLLDSAEGKALVAKDPAAALTKYMMKTDDMLRAKGSVPSYESGTTAIVSLLRGDRIWAACAGDSRCVMGSNNGGNGWRCTDLSVDQKPDDPPERARIEARGGYVSPASATNGPARVWRGAYGIGSGLAMARSLGDHAVAEVGVIAEPVVTDTHVGPDAEVLIAASDGVWEFITSEEALALVWQHRDDASKASKLLIEESTIRWRKAEGNYRDDITAIVVFLPIFSVLSGEPSIKSGSYKEQSSIVTFDTVKTTVGDQREDHDDPNYAEAPPPANPNDVGIEMQGGKDIEGGGDSPPGKRTFAKRRLSVATDTSGV